MALIHCDFFSETLGLSTSMYVILPQRARGQIGMDSHVSAQKHPTLFLLHGLSDDHTIWLRRTSIERYVAPLGIAVVMPAVHRSFYADMVHGYRYFTFMSEELPEIARSMFPLSEAREDNYVAGLSMGGYGAFLLALRKPHQFAAAASLSGALDMAKRADNGGHDFRLIYGDVDNIRGSEYDLLTLARETATSDGPKPALYQCCGTEDFLYEENQTFLQTCREVGLPVTYEEEPGTHEWGYWDHKIQRVLDWLPRKTASSQTM